MSTDTDPIAPEPIDDATVIGPAEDAVDDGEQVGGDPSLTQGFDDGGGRGSTVPVDPEGWLTLDDGTQLRLIDSDRDGAPDVTVQSFDEGWIVGHDVDGPDPRFEYYDADGAFLGMVDAEGNLLQQHEDEPAPVEPGPEPESMTFTVEGVSYTVTPDLDLDRNGIPESFSTTDENGHRVVMTDTDGDGVADAAFVETGEGAISLHFDGTSWIADESSYVPGPEPEPVPDDGAEVTVPPQFRQEVDPQAPLQVQVMQQAMDNYGLGVAELWTSVYPGEPWPIDDNGQPYHPNVLARVVANDEDLSEQQRQMGQEYVDHWDKLGNQAVASGPATAILSSAAECCTQSTEAPTVTLADGTVLQLSDSDLDGDADVLIRAYADRYVVINGADTQTPLVLTYALDGTLLETSLTEDVTDEEVVWEQEGQVQPADAMTTEVYEDSAFWFVQEGPTCALASLTQVVEDFLGRDVDVNDVKAYALAMGWYTEGTGIAGDGGTDFNRVDDILNYFGVPSEVTTLEPSTAMQQIDTWTAEGTAVIAWIDASAYWSQQVWPDSNGVASHAVRVLDVDMERGVVIVNDTALADGRALEVPLEAFSQAMQLSNYSVVTSLSTDPDGVGSAVGTGPLAESGFVLLPVRIVENPAWAAYLAALADA